VGKRFPTTRASLRSQILSTAAFNGHTAACALLLGESSHGGWDCGMHAQQCAGPGSGVADCAVVDCRPGTQASRLAGRGAFSPVAFESPPPPARGLLKRMLAACITAPADVDAEALAPPGRRCACPQCAGAAEQHEGIPCDAKVAEKLRASWRTREARHRVAGALCSAARADNRECVALLLSWLWQKNEKFARLTAGTVLNRIVRRSPNLQVIRQLLEFRRLGGRRADRLEACALRRAVGLGMDGGVQVVQLLLEQPWHSRRTWQRALRAARFALAELDMDAIQEEDEHVRQLMVMNLREISSLIEQSASSQGMPLRFSELLWWLR